MAALRIHAVGLDRTVPDPGRLRVHAIGLDRQSPPGEVGRLRIHAIGLSRFPDAPGDDGVFISLDGVTWTKVDVLVPTADGTAWDEVEI